MSMFPHTVTLYQTETVIDDKLNETTVNHITVLEGVLLIASKAANVRATGLEGADAVNLHVPFGVKAVDGVTGEEKTYVDMWHMNLHIPFDVNAVDGVTGKAKTYVDPVEGWKKEQDKSKVWTISIGTVFVKGRVIEPDASRTALELGYDDVYQVTKVDKIDFGSPDMQHWEVGGN